jgi:hypothetical protein
MNNSYASSQKSHSPFLPNSKDVRKGIGVTFKKCRQVEQTVEECLSSVTGHHAEALILQKFLYWTSKLWDFDQFRNEEFVHKCREMQPGCPGRSGWVQKTADDLRCELSAGLSKHAIRRHLRSLVHKGYLYEREDPVYPWEHNLQYRVNLLKLEKALARHGYPSGDRLFTQKGNQKDAARERRVSPADEKESMQGGKG